MKSAIFVVLSIISAEAAKVHNITVSGTVTCAKHRQSNVLVELWERDIGGPIDPHDLLAKIHSDPLGEFRLAGEGKEVGLPPHFCSLVNLGTIEPFIRITHNCSTKEGCTRRTEFDIPQQHVNGQPYDMGFIILGDVQAKDETTCPP
ncbi:hypothetical protein PRIPAC_92543 [Pristionchus pacificus]|uniref:Uncharacterized protein n=1 Tax=Pristionchus pacificus TaxID=54126 RepID=A0A2A6CDD3_PRIPA|nr:hypothetical protein PRIPAC_92543 [Pristionchus pacificus]|eukprot:PDM76214.1 hypothetical protein PRIPAC_39818 [Pristionchus pacificus]